MSEMLFVEVADARRPAQDCAKEAFIRFLRDSGAGSSDVILRYSEGSRSSTGVRSSRSFAITLRMTNARVFQIESGSHPACEKAAVDYDRLSCRETGGGRKKINGRADQLFSMTEAAQRR